MSWDGVGGCAAQDTERRMDGKDGWINELLRDVGRWVDQKIYQSFCNPPIHPSLGLPTHPSTNSCCHSSILSSHTTCSPTNSCFYSSLSVLTHQSILSFVYPTFAKFWSTHPPTNSCCCRYWGWVGAGYREDWAVSTLGRLCPFFVNFITSPDFKWPYLP